MTTLYIDRRNTRLTIESNTLVCFIEDKRQRPVPLLLLDQLIISSMIELSSTVLLKLAEAQVMVVFLNPRNSKQRASVHGRLGKNPHIRLAQYQAQQDTLLSCEIAQQWVVAKVKNQRRLLFRYQDSRKDLRYPLSKSIEQLTQALQTLDTPVANLDSLRGVEGSAARASFAAYKEILPNSLGFTGRKRRPPPDPVNACLSLAYTLLHARAVQAAVAQGFDPMIGFLHEPKYSRDSLAADIIEPWRPHVDAWVLEQFTTQALRKDDFTNDQDSCLLGKAGRYKFYAAYEPVLKTLTRGMRLQLFQLRKKLL
ncbi:CRISPR-associated endonuclease Cas1 [Leucothrix pacifica]|uniref:CRISPR-associated endonuclease Cas1 n=1 Tax=Leucothrix pacifica TaxID=1247513 RepID=A0A317CGH6_9GAMM|nr:CRISPR-associated endonuclease Cas1 [Leucothrix pacifica]PWQ97655.1 CRISPR-associated endonuclease Cas1 [Leucothrix pacifica]